MLGIGNLLGSWLTVEEEKTHFALWAIAKAPLIIGGGLAQISEESLAILKNEDLITVNKEARHQGYCVKGCTETDLVSTYLTQLENSDFILAVVNWGNKNATDLKLNLTEVSPAILVEDREVTGMEIWSKEEISLED